MQCTLLPGLKEKTFKTSKNVKHLLPCRPNHWPQRHELLSFECSSKLFSMKKNCLGAVLGHLGLVLEWSLPVMDGREAVLGENADFYWFYNGLAALVPWDSTPTG